jgi:hypothetical protein
MPDDENNYTWNESTLSWDQVASPEGEGE